MTNDQFVNLLRRGLETAWNETEGGAAFQKADELSDAGIAAKGLVALAVFRYGDAAAVWLAGFTCACALISLDEEASNGNA